MSDAWVDNFITVDPVTRQFVVYDETQANELGRCATWAEALSLLRAYAKYIEMQEV